MSTETVAGDSWSMSPPLRKLLLTTHVTFSVGWLGAVVAFLVLAIAGETSRNPDLVRGAYLTMNVIGWAAILPMSLVSLLTGLIQGLGTRWGLFKYWWVATKLVLTFLATVLLILHQFTAVAAAARHAAVSVGTLSDPAFAALRTQLVVDASLAVFALLVTTTLSIYKPWGLTAVGRRARSEATASPDGVERSSPLKIALIVALGLGTLVTVHILKGGMSHHMH
ncbi:MAG TPA: hypothetical protein VHO06_16365 [Polyangia bacterium]|nr:hypothetical protein [Polyangia bacterium]